MVETNQAFEAAKQFVKLHLVYLVAAGIVFGGTLWLVHREQQADRTRMNAALATQQQLIRSAQDQFVQLAAQMRQRDAAEQRQTNAILSTLAALKTPQQIVRKIPEFVNLPAPIALNPTKPGEQKGSQGATIPAPDLKPMLDYLAGCKICGLKLAIAQQDLATKNQQLKAAQEQLSAVERQRDAAIAAAKGGGFWTRVKRDAKWLAIGAAIGFAAAKK